MWMWISLLKMFYDKSLYYLLCSCLYAIFRKNLVLVIWAKMLLARIFNLTISGEVNDEIFWFLACWHKFMKIKSWVKIFWMVVIKNVCDASGQGKQKLALSQKWMGEINWLLHADANSGTLFQWFSGGHGQKWK